MKTILTKQLWLAFAIVTGMTTNLRAEVPGDVGHWELGPLLPYFPVHIHLLPTGKVLVWPGDGGVSGNDPRIWDPLDQSITAPPGPGYNTFCTGHTFLPDGSLLVTGGHIDNNVGLPKASIFNPLTSSWLLLPDMNAGRWYPTSTPLANGEVLTLSGQIDVVLGGNPLPQIYQPTTGNWRDLSNAVLSIEQYPRLFLAPNGKVFYASATPTTRYLDTSGSGAWSFVATRPSGYRDYGSGVMYEPGKVLVMGGGDPPTAAAEVIDLNAPEPRWRTVAPMNFPRRQLNSLLLPDGKVLVTGGTRGPGQNDPTPTNTIFAAEMWDPATETWSVMASATIQRIYHSATLLLPDGRVFSTGGNGYPQTELYSPPYMFKGSRPSVSALPMHVSYGSTFIVQTPDAATVAAVTVQRLPSVTHAFNQSTYINKLNFTAASDGLSVTAPPGGTIAPPGPYLLFLINNQGVPSVGAHFTIDVDNTPDTIAPTVSIAQPAAGTTVAGSAVTLAATATDNKAVTSVEFKVDGATLYTDPTPPHSISWNTITTLNGPHTVTAVARDAAGNTSVSASANVTVNNIDTAPPVVSMTAPSSGATVTGPLVTVSASATDNLAVASVQFKLDNVDIGGTVHHAPFSISWNSTTATNGDHVLTAVAKDYAGNTATSVDLPIVVSNSLNACPLVPLDMSGASPNGTVGYDLRRSFGTPADYDLEPSRSKLRLFENSVELNPAHALHDEIRDIGLGRYSHWLITADNFEFLLFSTSDNTDPRSNGRNYAFCIETNPVDSIPPDIVVTEPALGSTLAGTTVTVSATATDAGGIQSVQFKLDGNNLGPVLAGSPYTFVWDTTATSNGAHTLTAVATDTSGNVGTAPGVDLIVSNLIFDNCPNVDNPDQADRDADGVGDACDNCLLVANINQRDSDSDGFGNRCDADLNNDNIVNNQDLALFRQSFLQPNPNPNADFDGNGTVNNVDLAFLRTQFLKAPGPGALAPTPTPLPPAN